MIPDYGGNVRRSSHAATDLLLDEQADLNASPPPPGVQPPDLNPNSDPAIAALAPPDTGWPIPPAPPPPPAAVDPDGGDHGRFTALVPILLAALGLFAAVIAWRVGVAGNIADDANRAGINAARERAAVLVRNEGFTSRATEAFLDYERDRQRAEALAAAGANDQALLNRMQAVAHWSSVASEYFDRAGQYQPNQQRAALLAGAEQNTDIQPLAHFETADAEYVRLNGLILAGIILVFALPFLTLAEIGRGRLRGFGILAGSAIFAAGVVLAIGAWL